MVQGTTRVLVIDDDEDDFVIARDHLQRVEAGRYVVEWASNYAEGFEAMRSLRYDVFLIDYRIGPENGIDLLRNAHAAGIRVPMLMMTGVADRETDVEAMQAGAADYLVKGKFDGEQLARAIRYAVDRTRYLAQVADSEARYRTLFEHMPIPLWIYAIDSYRFLAVNDAAIDHYGWSREEFMAMSVLDVRPEEERETFIGFHRGGAMRGLVNAGLWTHLRRDGSRIDVEVTSHDIIWDGVPSRMVVCLDVTAQRRAEVALRKREVQLRQILTDVDDALVVVDADGAVCFANPAIEELFGESPDDLITRSPEWVRAVRQTGVAELEIRPGVLRTIESRVSETEWEGHDAQLVAMRDVTTRHAAEERARLLERAVESSANGVVICDARAPGAPITYVNRAFERITGYTAAEAIGRNPEFLQGDDTSQPEVDDIRKAMRARTEVEVVVRNYRKDGSLFWNQMSVAPVRNRNGDVTHFVGLVNDLTDRRRYEAELAYLATHDTVTGLPRFLAVEEFTKGALAEARHSGGRVAMFYIDLDRFHSINETMGHATGDQALRIIAERMRATVGERGRVSRIAGDEFVVVSVPGPNDDPVATAERLRLAVEQPIEAAPYMLYLTGSVGISVFPQNAKDAKDLLHQSEAAAARAKRQGRNAVCAFSNDQVQELADRLSLGGRLRDAARNNELILHYQPQVSAHNGQIIGLEALVRWQSPELGLLPPGRFIRVAEELGLIVDLGLWVLDTACRQARAWLDSGLSDFTIAVNVSALQLQRPTFVADVQAALDRSGLPPHHLELELTESSIMENVERMVETMHALKKLGVLLALDDFGIGYSSLNYLKRFPIDKLKIDQSFVRDVTRDSGDAGIARAIIAMGHQLQMTVMAEGVETAAQMGYLRRNHCDQFQGWLFGGPVPTSEAEALLRRKFLSPEVFANNDSGLTILLLDDEENILRSLTRLLRRDGYTILTANNAREAFDQLGTRDVQVVVSDQRMPDISGTEFLSQVKALYPETIRLVLSGYTDLKTVTEAINLGSIYKFLTKPWDDEELRREIREAFRAYEARRARDDAA